MICALIFAATMTVQQTRYYGTPDLALTSTMIQAGGGPTSFSSHKLFLDLTGSSAGAEAAALTKKYGAAKVGQFFTTFDTFVNRAVSHVQSAGIKLPAPSSEGGKALSQALYQAGVMPDGRYDVGYMLEHLLSRNMHKTLMNEVNADPAFGPAKNADFHVILTSAMQDLHKLYGGT